MKKILNFSNLVGPPNVGDKFYDYSTTNVIEDVVEFPWNSLTIMLDDLEYSGIRANWDTIYIFEFTVTAIDWYEQRVICDVKLLDDADEK